MQITGEPDFAARDHVMNRSLVELMGMSTADWDVFSRGSAEIAVASLCLTPR